MGSRVKLTARKSSRARVERAIEAKASKHRFAKSFVWYLLPTMAFSFALLYFSLGLAWGVFPPLVPVQGGSMRPFLQTGDVVLLHRVNPSTLKVGEVIAVETSKTARQTYGVPAQVVHRIIAIEHTAGGLAFKTKGDANAGSDVFITYAPDVVGIMIGKVPYLGYPVIFFKSRQGEIFAAAMILVALIYLGFLWKDRRHVSNPAISLLAYVIRDLSELKDKVQSREDVIRFLSPEELDTDQADGEPKTGSYLGEKVVALRESHIGQEVEAVVDRLEDALHETVERQRSSEQVLAELTEAVREYALHLKSHTGAIQGLAGAASNLDSTTHEIRHAISSLVQQLDGMAREPMDEPKMGIPELAGLSAGSSLYSQDDVTMALAPVDQAGEQALLDRAEEEFGTGNLTEGEPTSDFTIAVVEYYRIFSDS